ncbi:MAG: diphthine synthase [Candidatus Micrarchaeia archaeon]
MLFLVGTGLTGKDLTLQALEIMRESELYIDRYTSFISEEHTKFIERIAGRKLKRISRGEMEEQASEIVKRAKSSNIAIIVGGDPLMATTHKILAIEAVRQGVKIKVVHASSIVTVAIGESGLDFYKFGQVCTIPKWQEHYRPVSFYETIAKNVSNRQHSLVLLDYSEEGKASLPIGEALEILESAEKHYKKGIIMNNTKILVMGNIGSESQAKLYGSIGTLKSMQIAGPALLIIPSELSEIEKESMSAMGVKEVE